MNKRGKADLTSMPLTAAEQPYMTDTATYTGRTCSGTAVIWGIHEHTVYRQKYI